MAKELWVEKYFRTQSIMCLRIFSTQTGTKLDYRWRDPQPLSRQTGTGKTDLPCPINELNVEKADTCTLTQA